MLHVIAGVFYFFKWMRWLQWSYTEPMRARLLVAVALFAAACSDPASSNADAAIPPPDASFTTVDRRVNCWAIVSSSDCKPTPGLPDNKTE
jgi:hypothetical protein